MPLTKPFIGQNGQFIEAETKSGTTTRMAQPAHIYRVEASGAVDAKVVGGSSTLQDIQYVADGDAEPTPAEGQKVFYFKDTGHG